MVMRLRVQAPFAAFRTCTAGSYRPTSPFIPPSTAYGLLLNLAGIESRWDDGKSPMTLMCSNLPQCRLAIGMLRLPEMHTLYQQLHNYPVGSSGKEHAADCKGAKYNIQPVRREFLSGFDAVICMQDNDQLRDAVRQGLRLGADFRPAGRPRYGLPFVGDNSYLVDRLYEETGEPAAAYWYQQLRDDPDSGPVCGRTRLTVWIDRMDMSKTRNAVFAPTQVATSEPPAEAWLGVGPESSR